MRRLRRSNRPGPPPRLRGGAFVHFPPAESGQKGRRGALAPRAKCPPDPPFAHAEDGFCSTPAPRLPRGFAFSLWGTEGERHIPAPWLPLTRELSPQATEGENSQPVRSGYPALRRPAVSLPPSNPPGLPPPSSEGGKTSGGRRRRGRAKKKLPPQRSAAGHCFM